MSTSSQKLGAWFLKEQGKNFVVGCAVAAAGVIGSLHIVPHTFLLEKYKDLVHVYQNGFTIRTPKEITDRFQRTLNLLGIPEKEQKQFRPFMVNGFNIFSAGSFSSRFGVIVGLPINYTYIDGGYIDKQNIRVNESSVQWELDEGKLLLESLVVSENAQMYAMAREIEMRKSYKYYIDIFAGLLPFLACYSLGNNINIKLNLYARPRSVRMTLYGLLGIFGLGNYFCIKDFSQLHYEKKVDEYLVNKNPLFKEGGKEFYSKLLNKNIAMRKLMGKVGEKLYTPLGNDNYLIRQKHLPLVQRRQFFATNVGLNM